MVCLAVLNRLKTRMKNMDSEVFLFSSSKEIKTDRKKKYIAAHTHHANADVGRSDHTCYFLFHFSRDFFSVVVASFLHFQFFLFFLFSFFFFFFNGF